MSALEQLREVMSAPHDLVEEYDTDAVSVTSTVEDELEAFYNTECIVAERDARERYLVKWEDYPLDQCTWEPPEHLEGTDLIAKWKQVKQGLGKVAFQGENEHNIKVYEEAQNRAEATKERKYAKREKKRKKLQRRNLHVVDFGNDSSEEEPLVTARGGAGLFVEDERPTALRPQANSPTNGRPPPVPRKMPLPLQQSSSEDSGSEAQTSDDSVARELSKNRKAQRKADQRSATGSSLGTSILQKKKNAQTTVSEAASKTATAPQKPMQRIKVSAVTTKSAFPTVSGKDRTVVTTTSTSNPTESAASRTSGKAIRTAPQTQASRAINFIDQPKEQHRKEWSTEHHYNKMKFRGLAEKRSRTEGTPDFNALSFVNGPPPTLPKAVSRASSNPYGRRDITNRRVQERDPDDQPRLGQDAGPLTDWEKDKVPLMCNAWKLSSNCPYGAQKCRFMHRAFDPQGRPYQLGDINNWIPPKYRKPSLTCDYWYNGNRCTKTAEVCQYAHEDTGWTEVNGKPIERIHLPPDTAESAPRAAPLNLIPYKLQNPPITCNFWLRSPHGCIKTEAACQYAHWNTGWAPPEDNIRGPPIRIDPNLMPRFLGDSNGQGQPLVAETRPPGTQNQDGKILTCSSWLRDPEGCSRSDEACDNAHRNTGWATPKGKPFDPPVPLDPNQIPRHQRDQPPPRLYETTCRFWLRGPNGCAKSDEDCSFMHRNTGWITLRLPGSTINGNPERIDPNEEPVYRRYDVPRTSSLPNSFRSLSMSGPGFEAPTLLETAVTTYTADDPGRSLVQSPAVLRDMVPAQLPAAITSSQLNAKIEQFYNLNITEMFHSGVPGDEKPLERRAMLLYLPEEHSEECELITRWLLMHDVQVSNLWYNGAWTQFQQDVSEGKSGIIIAHPDFEQYVELPGFGEVLKQRTRLWSVGLQPPAEHESGVLSELPELQHGRVCIFPHGGFVYITDDVFEQKPQLALNIVKLFIAKIEQLRQLDGPVSPWLEVHDACLLWRLCVRPELMESLYQKCEENSAELAMQNPDYLSRAELYQLLTTTNYVEQDHPVEPLSLVQDKYPILSERREIAEHSPLDYFNRLANSQENANTHMIGYYAAMQSADLRRAYRYFYVVHTEPEASCSKEWKTSIHNIADVITPERCIDELSKPSKESLFDFLDWAMEPKELGSEAELEAEDIGYAPMEISPQKEITTKPAAC